MTLINDYLKSVEIAYSKPAGENWPARGRQLMNSYIRLVARHQFSVIKKAREKFSDKDIANCFWSSTQLRYLLTGEFIVGLKLLERDTKEISINEITEVTEYLLSLLKLKTVSDNFCLNGTNSVLSNSEVLEILKRKEFNLISKVSAKMLSASLSSLSWAYGYDTHFPNIMEVHGPYKVSENKQLLVREFNLKNIELVWGEKIELPEFIRMYLVFNNSDITIDWELHTETKTEFVLDSALIVSKENGVERVLTQIEVDKFIDISGEETIKQVDFVNKLPVLDKIRKAALLAFLQVKGVSDLVGVDWKPTKEVEEAIIATGEGHWFGTIAPKKKPVKQQDNWLDTFDPRVPKE